jgi:hypothetical protein
MYVCVGREGEEEGEGERERENFLILSTQESGKKDILVQRLPPHSLPWLPDRPHY